MVQQTPVPTSAQVSVPAPAPAAAPGGPAAAQPAAQPMADPALIGAVRQGATDTATAIAQGATDTAAAIQAAAARDDPLTADQQITFEENMRDAPLTAQLVAQGRLKPRDLLVKNDVVSYERALRNRRIERTARGDVQAVGPTNTRLAARPELTRYTPEPNWEGAKRYRPPRFAGPMY